MISVLNISGRAGRGEKTGVTIQINNSDKERRIEP